ncbi:hypothetical protein ACE2AJ_12015 [Aquihabitans daechungensis]|uniref:hypothetical protein n=1 Tax=Aquihabitans daechungensis TaxID=1052257 RepID=UPI003BA3C57A
MNASEIEPPFAARLQLEARPNRARRPRSTGRWVGPVAALLMYVGASSYGDTPDTRDSSAEIGAWFVASRGPVLVGAVLSLWALMLVLMTFSRIESLADRSEGAAPGPGIPITAMATVGITVLAIGMHLPLAVIAYVVAQRDPGTAAALFEVTLASAPVASVPLSLALLGTAVRTRRTRSTLARSSIVASAVLATASMAWAYSGAFSPDVAQQVLYGVLTLWLIGSAVGERHVDRAAWRRSG